jgi:hypothetical protein
MRLPPWRFKKTEKSQWVKVKKKKPGSIFRLLSGNSGRSSPMASKLKRQQTREDIGDAVVYLARADNVSGVALNVAGRAEVH